MVVFAAKPERSGGHQSHVFDVTMYLGRFIEANMNHPFIAAQVEALKVAFKNVAYAHSLTWTGRLGAYDAATGIPFGQHPRPPTSLITHGDAAELVEALGLDLEDDAVLPAPLPPATASPVISTNTNNTGGTQPHLPFASPLSSPVTSPFHGSQGFASGSQTPFSSLGLGMGSQAGTLDPVLPFANERTSERFNNATEALRLTDYNKALLRLLTYEHPRGQWVHWIRASIPAMAAASDRQFRELMAALDDLMNEEDDSE